MAYPSASQLRGAAPLRRSGTMLQAPTMSSEPLAGAKRRAPFSVTRRGLSYSRAPPAASASGAPAPAPPACAASFSPGSAPSAIWSSTMGRK